jgi:tetratricopeptide (TPR) repeat protein
MSREYLAIAFALLMLGSTALLALAQSDLTKEITFDITGHFEGGKPDSLQTYDMGIISYGMHQATLASGSLYNVLERYTEMSQTSNSEQIAAYLPRVQSKDSTLASDEAFLNLLRNAASENAMVQAQNEIFSQNYYEPAKEKASADGVTSALGIAIYYDTNIQGGLEYIRTATKEHFLQSTPTEQEWLTAFLDERRNYLLAVADNKRKNGLENDAKYLENSASSQGRVGVLEKLADAGNLDLDQGDSNQQISIGIFGKIYTIDSEFRMNDQETAQSTENEDTIDSTSVVADALKIGTSQSPVVWQEKDTKIEVPMQSTKEYVDVNPMSYKSTIPIPIGPAADALKQQGKYEEYLLSALQAAEERLAQDPQDGDTWHTKGLALYYLNRGDEANEAFARATELGYSSAPSDQPQPMSSGPLQSETVETLPAAINVIDISEDAQPIIREINPFLENTESLSPPNLWSEAEKQFEAQMRETPVEENDPEYYEIAFSDLLPNSISQGLQPITQAIETAKPIDESNAEEGSNIPTLYPTTSPPPDESNTGERSTVQAADLAFGSAQETVQQANKADTQGTSFGEMDNSFCSASSSDDVQSPSFGSSSDESDLGGINFTSIKLNYISVSTDSSGGVNLDLGLEAQKADGTSPGVNITNATRFGAIAFITGLAVPSNKFWVNLAPWEPDRIIDEDLSRSEVGRIMLEADLQMKRDFCNYNNPCANQTGKELWNLLDNKRITLVQWCINKYPGEIKHIDNIYFRPVTRHWIVPDKVYAYTNDTAIYIINATLNIKSETVSDHASFVVNNQDAEALSSGCLEELNKSAKEYNRYVKELEDSMILPYVASDVNNAAKYEDLRNVYVALALAQWYKSTITSKQDIFRENLDSSDFSALDSEGPRSPYEIWEDYVYSFENGEYKCWENTTSKSRLRSWGGVEFCDINEKLVTQGSTPTEVQDIVEEAIVNGYVYKGSNVVFGIRLHGDLSHYSTSTGSKSIETAIRQDPNLAITWINKGNTFCDQGKYNDAIEAYDEAIRLDKNLAIAWSNKGNAFINLGKYDDAIESYNKAIMVDPNLETAKSSLAIAWSNKGNKLSDQGKYDEAIQAYEEAIRLDPNLRTVKSNLAISWYNKGNTLSSQGKYAEAVHAYDEAIKLSPESPSTWCNKGNALSSLGNYDEAIQAYNEATRLDPESTFAWFNKGNALSKLGKHGESLACFEEAIRINPDFAAAWNNRDVALEAIVRTSGADAASAKIISSLR